MFIQMLVLSNFLRVCSRYIMGENDYLTLVDEEFLSVTKVFKIKKDVENYFAEALTPLTKEPEESHELQYRFLILSVWMRCDYLDTQIDPITMEKALKNCWIWRPNPENTLIPPSSPGATGCLSPTHTGGKM